VRGQLSGGGALLGGERVNGRASPATIQCAACSQPGLELGWMG
jgi:hypothetical protein